MKPNSVLYPTLLCIFFSLFATAQKNFQDGFLILPNNDTLRGQIDYREWNISPRKISFLDKHTGRTTDYTPAELQAFVVNGETYASFKVRIYPYTYDPILAGSENFSDQPYEKEVFMYYLTGKRLELYKYVDTTEISYYFTRRRGENAGQLRIVTRKVETENKEGFTFDEVYKDQLTVLMADCNAVSGQITRVPYKEAPLRKLFFSYNNCGKDTVDHQTVRTGRSVFFLPIIGFLNSKVGFSASSRPWQGMMFPSYNTLTGGVGALFILPRRRQQQSILADLLYNHFQAHSNTTRANDYLTDDATLNYNAWNLNLQFRYRFPTGNIRPFLQVGFSNTLITGNKSIRHEHDDIGDTNDYRPFLDDGFRKYWVGWVAGAGIMAGRFCIEGRASGGPGISSFSSTSSPVTNLYFLLSYAL